MFTLVRRLKMLKNYLSKINFTAYFPNSLRLNYSLFLAVLLSIFLPTLYVTFRIYLLGELPDAGTFNIIAQNAWVQLLYEVFNEGMLLPLYYLLGRSIKNREKFKIRLSLAFSIFCVVYFILSSVIYYFSNSLFIYMKLAPELHNLSKQYIHLEILATAFSSIYIFNCFTLYLLNAKSYVYNLLIIQVLLNILFDSLFVSSFSFSLKLGVLGVGYTNIAVNFILLFVASFFMKKLSISFSLQGWKKQFRWLQCWGRSFLLSGGESFVRNIIFILMILRMVNSVQESGTYWLANQFIWGWLLVPFLALSTLIKIDVAKNEGKIGHRLNGYFMLSTFFVLCLLITLPFWQSFLVNILNINNYKPVLSLIYVLIGFYIFFIYKLILESYFYGMGKIHLILYQTLIVNIIYYGIAFLFYLFDYLQFDLISLAYLFGGGMIFSGIVTLCFWYKFSDTLKLNQS